MSKCGVVNLDIADRDGIHWTAYVKRNRHIHYFDSVGKLKLPSELIKCFRSDGSRNIII